MCFIYIKMHRVFGSGETKGRVMRPFFHGKNFFMFFETIFEFLRLYNAIKQNSIKKENSAGV